MPLKNKSKKYLFFISSILIWVVLAYQNNELALIKLIHEQCTHITTDNLGNVYTLGGNSLKKYNSDGNQLKNFSGKNVGNLSFMDATNPLKILLFYQSFQQILFLDNMLAPTGGPILLEDLGYRQITHVCISENNGFWIFNKQNCELIKFDNSLHKIFESGNINQITGSSVSPHFITEQNNNLFLADTALGILVFDNFGTYHKTIPITGVKQFQVFNNSIIYFKNKKLRSYHIKTFTEDEIYLPDTHAIIARTEKEKLYLLKTKGVEIYRLKK